MIDCEPAVNVQEILSERAAAGGMKERARRSRALPVGAKAGWGPLYIPARVLFFLCTFEFPPTKNQKPKIKKPKTAPCSLNVYYAAKLEPMVSMMR